MAIDKKPEVDFQSMNTVSGLTPMMSRKRAAEKNAYAPSAIANFCAINMTTKGLPQQVAAEERFVSSPLSYEYRRETKRGAGTRETPPSVKDAEARRFREARRSVGAAVMAVEKKSGGDYQSMNAISGLTPILNRRRPSDKIVDEQKKIYNPSAITNFCNLNATTKPRNRRQAASIATGAAVMSRQTSSSATGAAVMAAEKKPELNDYQSMNTVSGLTPMINRKRRSIQGGNHNPYSSNISKPDVQVKRAPTAQPATNHHTIKPKSTNQAQRAGAAVMERTVMERTVMSNRRSVSSGSSGSSGKSNMNSPPQKESKDYQAMHAVSGLTPMVNRQRRNSVERDAGERCENKGLVSNQREEERPILGGNSSAGRRVVAANHNNLAVNTADANVISEALLEDPTKGLTPLIARTKAVLQCQKTDANHVSPTNAATNVVMQGGKFVLNRVPVLDFATEGVADPTKRQFFAPNQPNSRGKDGKENAVPNVQQQSAPPSRPGGSANKEKAMSRVRVPRFRPTMGKGREAKKQSTDVVVSLINPLHTTVTGSPEVEGGGKYAGPSAVDTSSPSDETRTLAATGLDTPCGEDEDAFNVDAVGEGMRQRRPARRPRGKRVMTPAPVSISQSYGGLFSDRSNPIRPSCLRPVAEGSNGVRPGSHKRLLSPAPALPSPAAPGELAALATPTAAKMLATPNAEKMLATPTAAANEAADNAPLTLTPVDPEQRRQLIQEKREQWREEKETMQEMKEEFDDLLDLVGI
jgi:hypothetical protein